MNNKLDFIFRRRSVRSFKKADVEPEKIRDLLEAAMAAPSAMARDPWNFVVISDKEKLKELSSFMPECLSKSGAPVLIVVCGDINRAHDKLESFMLQDCCAAVENILLAAPALGLGACWLGVHPRPERMEKLARSLNLPENIIPVAGIVVGVPEGKQPQARTRFREDAVHFEKW